MDLTPEQREQIIAKLPKEFRTDKKEANQVIELALAHRERGRGCYVKKFLEHEGITDISRIEATRTAVRKITELIGSGMRRKRNMAAALSRTPPPTTTTTIKTNQGATASSSSRPGASAGGFNTNDATLFFDNLVTELNLGVPGGDWKTLCLKKRKGPCI